MKLNFTWKNDGGYHQYCMSCHAETVERAYENGKTYYFCNTCKRQHERSIVIDPAIVWWTDDDNEYWHESSGVFIKNNADRFLFFERIVFPFALTIPSGHVDTGENAISAAIREVSEEVGISIVGIREVATDDIWGDRCRRGADVHRWHAYIANAKNSNLLKMNSEGVRPHWITLDEALAANIILPVRYMIEHHRHKITL